MYPACMWEISRGGVSVTKPPFSNMEINSKVKIKFTVFSTTITLLAYDATAMISDVGVASILNFELNASQLNDSNCGTKIRQQCYPSLMPLSGKWSESPVCPSRLNKLSEQRCSIYIN